MSVATRAQTDEDHASYAGWRVVAAAMLGTTFGPSTIVVLNFGLFVRSIQQDFHWGLTEVTIATTIVSYMIVPVSLLQGVLVDRFGGRRVILTSIPFFGVSVLALSVVPPVHWIYYAMWVLLPVAGTGLFPLSYLRVTGSWFRRRLGLAMGLANVGIGVGGLVIPLLIGPLIITAGWRSGYMLLGLIVLLVTFPVAWLLLRDNPEPERTADVAPVATTVREAWGNSLFRRLLAAFFLLGIINTAIIVHQVPLLIDAGATPARAVTVQSVYGLFTVIGRLLTGVLLDRFRAPLVMTIFTVGLTVACVLYALGSTGPVVFLCAALIGLALGAEFDVLGYMIKAAFGIASFGRLYGIVFAAFQLGAGFGAAFLPLIRERSGSYASGLWVFAVITVISAVIFGAMKTASPRAALARR